MSSFEKQEEQTDATFGAGAVIQLASLVLNPNGPELPETLKVRGEGQMARTSIVFFLAGP